MTRDIQPIQVFDTQAVKVVVDDIKVTLDESADCQYQILGADGTQLRVGRIQVTGEDYASWANDDQAFFDLVVSKLPVKVTVLPEAG